MVKSLRQKFIVVTMLSVVIVLTILMGIINLINYNSIAESADEKLEILAENGGSFPEGMMEMMNPSGNGNASSNRNDSHQGNPSQSSTTPPTKPSSDASTQERQEFRTSMEMPFETRYFTVELDADGSIVNSSVENIAAVTQDEAERIAGLLFSEGRTNGYYEDYRYLAAAATTDGNTLYIFIDSTRDKSSFRTFLYVSIAVSALGTFAVFLLVFFLSKAVTKPVAESYEKQKRFITDASHEIKTPLAIIQANTEVLELTEGEDNKWIKSIQHQIDRLTRLTERLVFLSRMDEEDNPIMEKRYIDLSEAVLETTEGYDAVAKSKNKEFFAHVDPGITAFADESMMRQLVSLLLDNAMKYSSEGGRVTLSLKVDGKNKLLTVTNTIDEGSIPDGQHPEYFDRFYRADKSRNSKSGSFGIGLSVVKAIADSHKGKVTAESKGTIMKFVVRLSI